MIKSILIRELNKHIENKLHYYFKKKTDFILIVFFFFFF